MAKATIAAREVEAFQVRDSTLADKASWPDWLREMWAAPYESNNTVNDLAGGRLMFRSGEAGDLYTVKRMDWIVRGADGYVFSLSDHLFAYLTGRAA